MTTAAKKHLELAIELHEGHMDGSVPTSPESQQELMDHLEQAEEALESEHGMGAMGGLKSAARMSGMQRGQED
jgi:hypothetical protein